MELRLDSGRKMFDIHTSMGWPVAALAAAAVASEVIVRRAANNAPTFYCSAACR